MRTATVCAMRRLLPAGLLLAGLLAGCGASRGSEPPDRAATAPATTAHTTTTAPAPERAAPRKPHRHAVRCPTGLAKCTAAQGRVIYIESVDPDGDGDLHVVAVGGHVTGPGLTVFDVEKNVRPAHDPHLGDLVSGAGPVYRGSYGQRQIQTLAFRNLSR